MKKYYSNRKVEKRLKAYCKEKEIDIKSDLANEFRGLMQEMYSLGNYDTYIAMTSFK